MKRLHLTDTADLAVIYDADKRRYSAEWLKNSGTTLENFIRFYQDCPSVGFADAGKIFGGAILHGEQMHLAILPDYEGRWGCLIPAFLSWLYALKDPVWGHVEAGNIKCMAFLKRLGWRQLASDSHTVSFIGGSAVTPDYLRKRINRERLRKHAEKTGRGNAAWPNRQANLEATLTN